MRGGYGDGKGRSKGKEASHQQSDGGGKEEGTHDGCLVGFGC